MDRGIDGTRPHPGPLPEGEGTYSGDSDARWTGGSTALALTLALSQRERGITVPPVRKGAAESLAGPHAFRTGFRVLSSGLRHLAPGSIKILSVSISRSIVPASQTGFCSSMLWFFREM